MRFFNLVITKRNFVLLCLWFNGYTILYSTTPWIDRPFAPRSIFPWSLTDVLMPRFIYDATSAPFRHSIPISLCRRRRIVSVKSSLCGSTSWKVPGTHQPSTFLRVLPCGREVFASDLPFVAGNHRAPGDTTEKFGRGNLTLNGQLTS